MKTNHIKEQWITLIGNSHYTLDKLEADQQAFGFNLILRNVITNFVPNKTITFDTRYRPGGITLEKVF